MTNNDIVPELTKHEFEEFVKEGIVLIDFFADWCMPCLMMSPLVEEIAEKLTGKAKVGKVNVESLPNIAERFNVSSIPNFTILKDGKMVEQYTGAMSVEELEEKIRNHI